MTQTSAVALSDIRIDGGTQPRSKIDEAVVAEYAAAMEGGAEFPPVAIFFDGVAHWLADGFHRFHAASNAHRESLSSVIHRGTRRDAVLYSVGANTAHGLRRTNEDKRRSVLTLLNDPEWTQWSDREIARHCGVHHEMVAAQRPKTSLADSASEKAARTFKNKHGTVTTMRTENIGRGMPGAKAERIEQIEELAKAGHNAAQIAAQVGLTEQVVRQYANSGKVTLPDHMAGKVRKVDNRRVIEQTVIGLESSAASLRIVGVSLSGIDKADAADWAKSMTESIRAFTKLRNQLKEYANGAH